MVQIRQGQTVATEVLLLRQNPLISLQNQIKLVQKSLDFGFVSRSVALSSLEDLLVCNLGNEGVKVGLFNRERLSIQVLANIGSKE